MEKSIKENDHRRPTVFISYNWGSDEIADELESRLNPLAEVKRDKTSIKPWGDLDGFMRSIRKQDFAVLIISDAYLRSDACLYEVVQLMKDENWDDRAMYIVMDDTHIYKPIDQVDYIKYWQEKCTELEDGLKALDPASTIYLADDLRKYRMISLNIGEFMDKVKKASNPKVDQAIDAVISKVGEMVSNSQEFVKIVAVDDYEDKVTLTQNSSDVPFLRDGWNFHNDIALRLEMKARHIYGDSDRPFTKIYDADAVEGGKFAEVMIDVLRTASNRENDRNDIDEFITKCSKYIGMTGYQIKPEEAQLLLNRFMELVQK